MSEYNPKEIEPKWQQYWEEQKTFKLAEGLPGENKLYILDMFPYPSGNGLHIGHPLGYTGTDIYSRFKRMQGYSVLHPMGFDAFGLPAEQHAISTGAHPAKVTKENCKHFVEQLKILGFSYDWDRELATTDEDYYRWTQWIFVKIYNSWFDKEEQRARPIDELPIPEEVSQQGIAAIRAYQAEHRLAYYQDAMVNWCPALGTVLANEEVIEGKSERGGHDVIRRPMKQWLLRITEYAERLLSELELIDWPEGIREQQRNWIGKSHGARIDFEIAGHDQVLTCFTTRPDTLFGATFFAVSPEHPLVPELTTPEQREKVEAYCEQASRLSELARTMENREKTGVFTGSYVINPVNNEQIPVYVGDYVLMAYGTGAVMAVPAHDDRDFEFARLYHIEIRPVIAPDSEDEQLVADVISGESAWTGTGVMLPCAAPLAQELGLEGRSNEETKKLIVSWLQARGKGEAVVQYRLKDWLFSRQRYWGEPIPIVHWDDGTHSALSESELPLLLPEVADYKPSESGESPLAKAGDWLDVEDPKTGQKGRRETNTMPQWAGSCWYYLRFINPHNQEMAWDPELEKAWMPVDLYVGGAEHAVLHLLYARFWHKILFDLGHVSTREPFQRLFNQGMLTSYAFKDSRGVLVPIDEVDEIDDQSGRRRATGEVLERITAKMSKSLRNVVNPDEVIEQYGADTLRTYLMFMGPLNMGKSWDSKAINGNYRFLRRVWSFVLGGPAGEVRPVVPEQEESEVVIRARHRTVKRVTEDLDGLRFNTAIAALMQLLNEIGSEQVSRTTLEVFVLLLSPLAPHISEELWNRLGNKESLAYSNWPEYDEGVLQEQVTQVVIQVQGKKRGLIEVATNVSDDLLKEAVIAELVDSQYAVGDNDRLIVVRKGTDSLPKLVNVIPG